jgi:plastocyanin
VEVNRKKILFIGLLVIAVVLISGCTTTTTTQPAPTQTSVTTPAPVTTTPAPVSVAIKSSTFVPGTVGISKGTTVTWTNDDGVQHTVTSVPQGAFDSGPIDTGKTYSYTFNQAGTFEYSCTIHPSIPHGNVIVT